MKHYFESIIKTNDDVVTAQMLGYETLREAETKFHEDIAYGLKLDTIVTAYYAVRDEHGVELLNKFIDNGQEE